MLLFYIFYLGIVYEDILSLLSVFIFTFDFLYVYVKLLQKKNLRLYL